MPPKFDIGPVLKMQSWRLFHCIISRNVDIGGEGPLFQGFSCYGSTAEACLAHAKDICDALNSTLDA